MNKYFTEKELLDMLNFIKIQILDTHKGEPIEVREISGFRDAIIQNKKIMKYMLEKYEVLYGKKFQD
jgi:hypothetical protein